MATLHRLPWQRGGSKVASFAGGGPRVGEGQRGGRGRDPPHVWHKFLCTESGKKTENSGKKLEGRGRGGDRSPPPEFPGFCQILPDFASFWSGRSGSCNGDLGGAGGALQNPPLPQGGGGAAPPPRPFWGGPGGEGLRCWGRGDPPRIPAGCGGRGGSHAFFWGGAGGSPGWGRGPHASQHPQVSMGGEGRGGGPQNVQRTRGGGGEAAGGGGPLL